MIVFRVVVPYVMLTCTRNTSDVLSREEDILALTLHSNSLGRPFTSISTNERAAAEMRHGSAAVDDTLRFVTFLYVKHFNSELTTIFLSTVLKRGGKLIM